MKISGTKKNAMLTVNGKRCGVWIQTGRWIGNLEGMIKLHPKRGYFPTEFRTALTIDNGTDIQADYFEQDSLRLFPGHPLYDAAAQLPAG